MANNKSSTPAPGIPQLTGGSSSGANVPGIGPVTAIKPPRGFEVTIQQLLAGASKDLPAGGALPMGGTQVTLAQIQGLLQPVLDAFTALGEAEQAAKKAVGNARLELSALLPQAHAFVGNLKVALIAFFGKGNPILKDFGIKDGATRRKSTAATKVAAAVKATETRKLRGTTGKSVRLAKKFQGQVQPATAVTQGTGGSTGGGNSTSGAA